MPVTPPAGSCELWVTAADLARCNTVTSCTGCDPSAVPSSPTQTWDDDDLCVAATEFLFEASGRRYPGECTCTIWPAEEPCGHLSPTCGCTLPVVELDSQWPVLSITQVIIDGAVVDPATYRVDDWSRLVRVADSAGQNPGWPRTRWPDRNHPTVPTPGAGTFSVQYRYGRAVPMLGRIAALALACHLRSWTEPVAQLVGDNVTSLSYAGMSMARESTSQAVAAGRTGIIEVDRFLESVPGGPAVRPPVVGIWTPGLAATAPTRRTWP